MQQINSSQVLLYAFWLKRNDDEPHIGYGIDKNKFILGLTITVIFILLVVFLLLTKMFSLILYVVTGNVLYLVLYLMFINKYIGWYEVNEEGKPVKLICKGFLAPEIIRNRKPVSKKRFIQEANYE